MSKDIILAIILALLFYVFGVLTSLAVVPPAIDDYVARLRAVRRVEAYLETRRLEALKELYQYIHENEVREA
tara:strand:- start:11 stop:226 length:216 start_codon:yes stop_codon:yes gene_type:complete